MKQACRRKLCTSFACVMFLGVIISFEFAYGQDISAKLEDLDKQGVVLNETSFVEMLESAFEQPFLDRPVDATPETLPCLERILRITERYIDAGQSLPSGMSMFHAGLTDGIVDIYLTGHLTEKDPNKAIKYVERGIVYAKKVSADNPSQLTQMYKGLIPAYFRSASALGMLRFYPNALIDEYSANELKADKTITGKEILISVEPDKNTTVTKEGESYVVKYVNISAGLFISCVLAPDSLAFFADFDTPVILKGVCRGLTKFKTIEVDNCQVIEPMMPVEGDK